MTIAPPEVRKARATIAAHKRAQRKARPAKVQPVAAGQRQPRKHDKLYLAWIRRLPCAVGVELDIYGLDCAGAVQAAHCRYSDACRLNPGMSAKPDDRFTTPLCRHHHAEQHSMNERRFWAFHGIEVSVLMSALSAAYDAGQDGAAVVQAFSRGAPYSASLAVEKANATTPISSSPPPDLEAGEKGGGT